MTMKSPAVQLRSMIQVIPFLLHSAIPDLEIKACKTLFYCALSLNQNFMQEMTFVFESK